MKDIEENDIHKYYFDLKSIEDNLLIPTMAAADNDMQLKVDPYLTFQQIKRDEQITKLLQQYVSNYTLKTEFVSKGKSCLLYWSLTILAVLIAALCFLSSWFAIKGNSINDVIKLIASAGSIVTIFVGTLKVITLYIFNKDDEKNITEIVKCIQENDLKNKIENIKAEQKENNQDKDIEW